MTRIIISLLLLLFFTASCDLFQKKQQPIDFASLDDYPFFSTCDSLAKENIKKACFEETIYQYIQKDLDTCMFMSQSHLKNTGLIIHFDVHKDGHFSIFEIEKINNVAEAVPELENQIIKTFENLPKITPGKKQGQIVTSRFMIPLYIEKY